MKNKAVTILILALCLSINVLAQANLNKKVPKYDPHVKVGKLDNGLTYFIRKNSTPAKKIELRLGVNVGSILERKDQRGLAHFLEHMAFNGSKNFPKNNLIEYFRSIGSRFGADINAATGIDQTTYRISISSAKKEYLRKGLLALSDWAGGLTLDPVEVDKERGVVVEELRSRANASNRATENSYKTFYKGSAYEDSLPGGSIENIKNFKMKSLVDFYEDWYRPDLMAIAVVGDIDVAEVESQIKELFSPIKPKRKAKKRHKFLIPESKETRISIETDKEISGISFRLSKKTGAVRKAATLGVRKQRLVESLFGLSMSDRLASVISSGSVDLVFASGRYARQFRHQQGLTLTARLYEGKVEKGISDLFKEYSRIKKFGFTEAELVSAKKRQLTRLQRQFVGRDKQRSGSLASGYIQQFMVDDYNPGIEYQVKMDTKLLSEITLADLNGLIPDLFEESNRLIGLTATEKEGLNYPSGKELVALIEKAKSAKLEPYVSEVSNEPLVGKLPMGAKVIKESFDKDFGIRQWRLSNGIKLWFKKTDFTKDSFQLFGFSPGGFSIFSDKDAIKASTFRNIFQRVGVKDLTSAQLRKKVAGQQAQGSVTANDEFEQISGSATNKSAETMLQLIYLKFTNPNLNENFLRTKKRGFLSLIKSRLASPRQYFTDAVQKFENKGNPRFVSLFDTEPYENLELKDVKMIHKKLFSDASDYNIVIVGDFDLDKLRPLLLKYLGNLPVTNEKRNWRDVSTKTLKGPIKKVFYAGTDDKARVQLKVEGDFLEVKDEAALGQLRDILRIKLTQKLREELGGVYGASVRMQTNKVPRKKFAFNVSFICKPTNVDQLVKATLKEIEELKKGNILDSDIDKVQKAALITISEAEKINFAVRRDIVTRLQENRPLLTEKQKAERVKSVDKKQLVHVARKYLDFDNAIQYVLLPKAMEANTK